MALPRPFQVTHTIDCILPQDRYRFPAGVGLELRGTANRARIFATDRRVIAGGGLQDISVNKPCIVIRGDAEHAPHAWLPD
jgi:hypothetical protein